MQRIRHRIATLGLAGLLVIGTLATSSSVAFAHDPYRSESRTGFNDEYVFATTRGLTNMEDIHPAFKVTLLPLTIVLDTVFLPFAVIAGFIS